MLVLVLLLAAEGEETKAVAFAVVGAEIMKLRDHGQRWVKWDKYEGGRNLLGTSYAEDEVLALADAAPSNRSNLSRSLVPITFASFDSRFRSRPFAVLSACGS